MIPPSDPPRLTRRSMLTRTAAVGGAVWATPVVLATPAGASSGTGILIDTLEIPTGARTPVSSVSLEAGRTYLLCGSGTVTVSASGFLGDVEYAYRADESEIYDNNSTFPSASTREVDYGVKFDGQGDGFELDPRWGPYTSSHRYEYPYTPPTTGPITLVYEDPNYDDNSGSLLVEIYEV